MNNSYKLRRSIALLVGTTLIPVAAHAALPTGTVLTITGSGTSSGAWTSGSYFAMDTNGNSKVAATEKFSLQQGPDGGIIIGVTQNTNSHASHSGPVHPGAGGLDAEWSFFSNAGMDYTTTSIIELSPTTVRMSGWTVTWNGIAAIPMGTGAWATGTGAGHTGATGTFTNGVGILTWDGTNGGSYTLDYRATVPANDPSGFGGVRYELHLEGTVVNGLPTAGNVNMGSIIQDTNNNPWTPNAADPNTSAAGGTANTSLTCTIVTPAAHGTATVAANCSSGTYTPTGGYTGADSFTYRVNDGLNNSATNGTVSVNVLATGSNLPPTANDDTAIAGTATATVIDVISNDTDTDGTIDATTVVATDPPHGSVVDNDDGTVTYTSDANFTGTDTFTYTVDDDDGDTSNSATVTITVSSNTPSSTAGTTLSGGAYDTDNDGRADSTVPTDSATSSACIGGCFDFVITGVAGSVDVALPLTEALPDGAGSRLVYRKYDPNSSTWRTFTPTNGNALKSAVGNGTDGTPAICPPPGTSDGAGVTGYRSGITPGDRCIQLTLVDNGDWDSNSVVGTVADPGGMGIIAAATPAPVGTNSGGGCTLSTRATSIGAGGDWLLVGAALAGLGVFRRRIL